VQFGWIRQAPCAGRSLADALQHATRVRATRPRRRVSRARPEAAKCGNDEK
jgi:hypothetical protein